METLEREKLKKKLKIYEKLGALKFQKAVFVVEKIKYKIIKKVCPNFIHYYDKYCDFKKRKAINKANSELEINNIIKNTLFAKMAMRKEINQEKNRNYHIDKKKPTEIYKYLEWNKRIHKEGLIKNSIVVPILVAGTITQIPGALPLLILEIISAGINFECINIQNYNICRYKLLEEKLKKKEEKQIQKNLEEYDKASKVIAKTIDKKRDLPSIDEIIENIHDKEQLEQLRKLVAGEQKERSTEKKLEKARGII